MRHFQYQFLNWITCQFPRKYTRTLKRKVQCMATWTYQYLKCCCVAESFWAIYLAERETVIPAANHFFFFLKKRTLVFELKTLPLLLAISCSIRHITTKVAAAVVRTAVAEELAEGHNDVDLKELMHMSEVFQIHFNLSHSCACPRWRCTWSTQVMHLVCAFYAGRDCGLCSSQYVVPYLLPACSWEMRPHIISLQS